MLTTFQKLLLATIAGSALVLGLVLAAHGSAAGATPIVLPPQGAAPLPGVTTAGEGTVKVKPDVAILTMGVTAQAATAAEAQTAVGERFARVLQRAKDLGIADRDTKSAGYSINPQYASGPGAAPKISGYQAMQLVALTLRDVAGAGKAIDALVQNDGATNAQVRFALDEAKAPQADARKLAIDDARAKAEAMARAAGIRLGKVTSVSDLSSGPQPYFDAYKSFNVTADARAAAAQLPPGELDVVVRVQVQFAID